MSSAADISCWLRDYDLGRDLGKHRRGKKSQEGYMSEEPKEDRSPRRTEWPTSETAGGTNEMKT